MEASLSHILMMRKDIRHIAVCLLGRMGTWDTMRYCSFARAFDFSFHEESVKVMMTLVEERPSLLRSYRISRRNNAANLLSFLLHGANKQEMLTAIALMESPSLSLALHHHSSASQEVIVANGFVLTDLRSWRQSRRKRLPSIITPAAAFYVAQHYGALEGMVLPTLVSLSNGMREEDARMVALLYRGGKEHREPLSESAFHDMEQMRLAGRIDNRFPSFFEGTLSFSEGTQSYEAWFPSEAFSQRRTPESVLDAIPTEILTLLDSLFDFASDAPRSFAVMMALSVRAAIADGDLTMVGHDLDEEWKVLSEEIADMPEEFAAQNLLLFSRSFLL